MTISDTRGRASDGSAPSALRRPCTLPLTENAYRGYLDDLLSGNRQACMDVVQKLLGQKVGVRSIYLDLFQRSLYDVGSMWERNEISVAVEHLATAGS
jgi:MerR family transcriptional regulator, light-induced transcriptional regulator